MKCGTYIMLGDIRVDCEYEQFSHRPRVHKGRVKGTHERAKRIYVEWERKR